MHDSHPHHEPVDAAFRAQASYGRRLVRLGAQLLDDTGTLINRDHARAWLPGDIAAGESADVTIDVDIPDRPGRYRLKFDLVSEGIDWFEACGSETTEKVRHLFADAYFRPATFSTSAITRRRFPLHSFAICCSV